MDREKASAELLKKLDPANVKPPKQFGPKGDYIESWHAIAEANRIFGHFGWNARNVLINCVAEKPRKIGKDQKDGWGVTYVCTREITVDGVVRQGSGAGHGYDLDLGLAHESAIKEAESDAEKRALRTFGNPFGLALYDKSRENVGVDFDPAPTIELIKESIGRADTVKRLTDVWIGQKAQLDEVKATAPALYGELVAYAAVRKSQLDPALQAPQEAAE